MKYQPPVGATDPDAPYINRNLGTGTQGSRVPAEAIEDPQREIINAITQSGQTPDEVDLLQLWKAMKRAYKGTEVLFDTVGTTNWTVPAEVFQIFARVWGGGGGGGGGFNAAGVYAGEGGAGGGYAEGWFTVTPGQVLAVTVGSGGAGGAAGGVGGAGGTSSVGVLLSATGGQAGRFADMATTFARSGGTGSGGSINMTGGYGNVILPSGTTAAIGGAGGDAPMGGSGACNTPTGAALGIVPGGGGGGAAGSGGLAGAAGGRGRVIIRY